MASISKPRRKKRKLDDSTARSDATFGHSGDDQSLFVSLLKDRAAIQRILNNDKLKDCSFAELDTMRSNLELLHTHIESAMKSSNSASNAQLNCPSKHGLFECIKGTEVDPVIAQGRMTCDVCRGQIRKGQKYSSCRQCNYDVCNLCMNSPTVDYSQLYKVNVALVSCTEKEDQLGDYGNDFEQKISALFSVGPNEIKIQLVLISGYGEGDGEYRSLALSKKEGRSRYGSRGSFIFNTREISDVSQVRCDLHAAKQIKADCGIIDDRSTKHFVYDLYKAMIAAIEASKHEREMLGTDLARFGIDVEDMAEILGFK